MGIFNPDLSETEEQIVIATDKKFANDNPVATLAHVILLSYNRPNMLFEAAESVVNQTHTNLILHVLDDGSDFDVHEKLEPIADERCLLYSYPKMSPEERTRVSRLGENINSVLEQTAPDDVVFYLCDDDILHPQWLQRSLGALLLNPKHHVVQGTVYTFLDHDDWRTQSVYGMPGYDPRVAQMWLGTGTFCHSAKCVHEEGLRWYDNEFAHSQDLKFINDISNLHPDFLYIDSPSVYRRDHKGSLSSKLGHKDENGKYRDNYKPGPAKIEHISGMME